MQAKGLIFFIMFGLFVENHLLESTKFSFLVSWFKSYLRPFVCLSHFCLEHMSKSIEDNLMKIDTLIEGHEGICRMQEL